MENDDHSPGGPLWAINDHMMEMVSGSGWGCGPPLWVLSGGVFSIFGCCITGQSNAGPLIFQSDCRGPPKIAPPGCFTGPVGMLLAPNRAKCFVVGDSYTNSVS